MSRILVVTTSTSEYQKAGYRTGLWLSELTHFVDAVREAGHEVEIVSITGGQIPLDPESLTSPMLALGGVGKRYRDRQYMDQLYGVKRLDEVNPDEFDAIYLTGGHGTMFDFPQALRGVIGHMAGTGKVVSAVCHGVAGLLDAEAAGRPFLEGRKVTVYSWTEEKLVRRAQVVPFSLEEALTSKGAEYSKATLPMAAHVVIDGRLVTGQNPTSAKGVAKAVIDLLA